MFSGVSGKALAGGKRIVASVMRIFLMAAFVLGIAVANTWGADAGAGANDVAKHGSALMQAVYNGDEPAVWTLLKQRGTKVNAHYPEYPEGEEEGKSEWAGFTALHFAVALNRVDITKLLLEHDYIKLNIQASWPNVNGSSGTPLHLAVDNGHTDIVRLLLEDPRIDVNAIAIGDQETALQMAVYKSSNEITKMLVTHKKAKLNASYGNVTALHNAIYAGNIDALDLLLRQPSINTKATISGGWEPSGGNALHLAAQFSVPPEDERFENNSGDTLARDMMDLILKRDPSLLNTTDDMGDTALITASYFNAEAVALLLKYYTIDINAINKEGDTALHRASRGGEADIVKLLLKHNIQTHVRNNKGETALNIAQRFNYTRIVDMLKQHDAAKSSN